MIFCWLLIDVGCIYLTLRFVSFVLLFCSSFDNYFLFVWFRSASIVVGPFKIYYPHRVGSFSTLLVLLLRSTVKTTTRYLVTTVVHYCTDRYLVPGTRYYKVLHSNMVLHTVRIQGRENMTKWTRTENKNKRAPPCLKLYFSQGLLFPPIHFESWLMTTLMYKRRLLYNTNTDSSEWILYSTQSITFT